MLYPCSSLTVTYGFSQKLIGQSSGKDFVDKVLTVKCESESWLEDYDVQMLVTFVIIKRKSYTKQILHNILLNFTACKHNH